MLYEDYCNAQKELDRLLSIKDDIVILRDPLLDEFNEVITKISDRMHSDEPR